MVSNRYFWVKYFSSMHNQSPKRQAIIIAVLSAIFSYVAGLITMLLSEPNHFVNQAFISLLVFFVVFLLVFYFLNDFIFKKLKPIYKTIHTVNFSEKKLKVDMEEKDRDLVQDVQDDVLKWAKNKTREIAQLRQLERYRREFLGNVSHELKTPIFNIQGYVSTLLDGGLHDDNINELYLERTDKSVNRLISIVNDLESISRLESGELKLIKSSFDIVRLVEDVFEDHEMLAMERSISLSFVNYPEKPVVVYADKQRILEVLNNLVVNSIKYGKQGGKTKVDFMDMDDQVLIEVRDNGIGIKEQDLPRIFERFYRTDKSRSRDIGGTGLGLSIVKHIIEAHKQTINVSSKFGEGSSFNFTLQKAQT